MPESPQVCPACASDLGSEGDVLACRSCLRRFATVSGIPDLRLDYGDPYVSRDEDLLRARRLAALSPARDLDALLAQHWRDTGRPPELADRFITGDRVALARADAYLDALELHRGDALGGADAVLEVGCGTAALAAAAARRTGARTVATDISLRWLVLAKQRLSQLGDRHTELVCCNAEQLPYASGSFSVVIAGDVIEHVARPDRLVADCARVLRDDGILFIATPNRLSLGLEPHVRLWGVGLLPRRLAGRYVKRMKGADYDHVRLLSRWDLRRLLAQAGLDYAISAPPVPEATRATYGKMEGRLVDLYNRLRDRSIARQALLVVGPFFHVFGRKGSR